MKMRTLLLTMLTGSSAMLATGCMDPVRASAGGDRTVDAGATVMLDGSSSFPRDASRLSYLWEVTSEQAVTFGDATAAVTQFTAPQSTSETTLRIRLTVTYIGFTGELVTENSDSDEVIVRVRADANADEAADTNADDETEMEETDETDETGESDETDEDTTPVLETETTP